MEEILLKNCKLIVDALNPLRKNFDILIKEGKIYEIGENLSKKGLVIDCSNCAVIPGILNGHTHTPMSILRGIAEDLPLNEWLTKRVWPLEKKFKEEHYYIGAKVSIFEMLKSGFTGASDMYFKMDVEAKAYMELNFRGILCEGIFDFFNEDETEKQYKIALDSFKKLKNLNSSLIKPSLGPHAIYTCSKELLRMISDLSKELNSLVQIHVAESFEEQEFCLKKYGKREVKFLHELGLCNERTIYAHGVWFDDEEIKLLKENNAAVVQNTISNLKLGIGSTCNIRRLIDEGIRVCLGTDGPASNNSLDAFEMLKFSALIQKHMHRNPSIISSKELFKIATYEAYKIFFPELKGGIIEKDAVADLVIIDLNNIRLKPLNINDDNHIIYHLIYSSAGMQVKHVIINGKLSVYNYKVLNVNEEELFNKLESLFNDLIEKN